MRLLSKIISLFALIISINLTSNVSAQLAQLQLASPNLSTALPLDIGTDYTFTFTYNYLFTPFGVDIIDPASVEIVFIPSNAVDIISDLEINGHEMTMVINPNVENFKIIVGADDILGEDQTPKSFANFSSVGLTVPVQFVAFDASINDKQIHLNWSTAVEVNNDRFEIERSFDGVQFHQIGQVKGSGQSDGLIDYKFIDNHPHIGSNYYRLKQLDYNGEFDYSALVSINYQIDSPLILAPNPIQQSDNAKLFVYNYGISGLSELSIFNLSGQLVDRTNLQLTEGQNAVNIETTTLNVGMYMLQIKQGSQINNLKMIIN